MSALFSAISRAFSYSQQRLVRFFLNSTLRSYLRTPVDADLFGSDGSARLENIDLNEAALNAKLAGTALAGLVVRKGALGRLLLTVPWAALATENPKVSISGLRITVVPAALPSSCRPPPQPPPQQQHPRPHAASLSESEDMAREEMLRDARAFDAGAVAAQDRPTLSSLEALFQHMLGDLEVQVDDALVEVVAPTGQGVALRLEHAHYGAAPSSSSSSAAADSRVVRRRVQFGGVSVLARAHGGEDAEWAQIAQFVPGPEEEPIDVETRSNAQGALVLSNVTAALRGASLAFSLGCSHLKALLAVFAAVSEAFFGNAADESPQPQHAADDELTASLVDMLGALKHDHGGVSLTRGTPQPPLSATVDPLASSVVTAISPYSTWAPPRDPNMVSQISFELGSIEARLTLDDSSEMLPVLRLGGVAAKVSSPPARIRLSIRTFDCAMEPAHPPERSPFSFFKIGSAAEPSPNALAVSIASPRASQPESKTSNYELAIGVGPIELVLRPEPVSFFMAFLASAVPIAQPVAEPSPQQQQQQQPWRAGRIALHAPLIELTLRMPPGGELPLPFDPREFLGREHESVIEVSVSDTDVVFRNSSGNTERWQNISLRLSAASAYITRAGASRRKILSASFEDRRDGRVMPSLEYSTHNTAEPLPYIPRETRAAASAASEAATRARVTKPPAVVVKSPDFARLIANAGALYERPQSSGSDQEMPHQQQEKDQMEQSVAPGSQAPTLNETFATPTVFFATGGIKSADKMDWDWDSQFATAKFTMEVPVIVADLHPFEIALALRVIPYLMSEAKDMMATFINVSSARAKIHDAGATAVEASTSTGKHLTLDLDRTKVAIFLNYLRTPNMVASVVLQRYSLKEHGYCYTRSDTALVESSLPVDIDYASMFPAMLATSKLRVVLFDGSQALVGNTLVAPVVPAFMALADVFAPPQLAHLAQQPVGGSPSPPPPPPPPQQTEASQTKKEGRLRAYMKRACAVAHFGAGASLLMVLDGLEAAAERKDSAFHIFGPTFRRLRILFRTTPFVWNPVAVVERSIHPLKESGWSTLLSWPPKQHFCATQTALPPPVFDLVSVLASGSIAATVDFKEKPLRVKISRESLSAVLSMLDGMPRLLEAIMGPAPAPPPQEELDLYRFVIEEYNPSATAASAATSSKAPLPPMTTTVAPVVVLDEIGTASRRDDPDVVPPLPSEVTEGIRKVQGSSAPRTQGRSDVDDDEDEDDDDVFFDAEDFSSSRASLPATSAASSAAAAQRPKEPPTSTHVSINAKSLSLEVQFVRIAPSEAQSRGSSRSAKPAQESKDFVLFQIGARSIIAELSPPGTKTVLKASVAISALQGESHVSGSSWGRLLYVDEKRLATWRGRKKGENVLPDVAMLRVDVRHEDEATTVIGIRTALQPLRISIVQSTLSLLLSVFDAVFARPEAASKATGAGASAPKGRKPQQTLVDELRIAPIGLKLDYKPQPERGIAKLQMGGFVWALRLMPSLTGTRLLLQEVRRTQEDSPMPLSELSSLLSSLWMPGISQVLVMTGALKPVHVVVRLAGGVASVVKVPVEQYRDDGAILKGLSRGFQTMAVEFLDVGSKATLSVVRLLRWTDDTVSGGNAATASAAADASVASPLADTPATLHEGATSALRKLTHGFASAFQGIAFQPVREYCHAGGLGFIGSLVRNVPGLVIRPVAGAADAVAQVLLSARNTVDPSRRAREQALYRHPSTEAAAAAATTEQRRAHRLGMSDFEDMSPGEEDVSSSRGDAFVPLQSSEIDQS